MEITREQFIKHLLIEIVGLILVAIGAAGIMKVALGTGAYGLNLQFCNKIAFSSITFDYAKTEQSLKRIKRMGQEKDIEYIYFTSNLGIFNMIFENNEKKRNLKSGGK